MNSVFIMFQRYITYAKKNTIPFYLIHVIYFSIFYQVTDTVMKISKCQIDVFPNPW